MTLSVLTKTTLDLSPLHILLNYRKQKLHVPIPTILPQYVPVHDNRTIPTAYVILGHAGCPVGPLGRHRVEPVVQLHLEGVLAGTRVPQVVGAPMLKTASRFVPPAC